MAGALQYSAVMAAERADGGQPLLSAPVSGAGLEKSSCMMEGGGFLRAKLSGSMKSELNWGNDDTECSGATRPNGGVRMRFAHAFGNEGQRLTLVFGIPGLQEGVDARALPVNLTIIREGAGEFYGTRGDDKCTIDKLHQEAIAGIPLRNRRYRIIASGFCTKPARAIAGNGSVLVTRFDFSGRVDYSEEDKGPEERTLADDSEKSMKKGT
jgi:hypothetical protein